MGKSIVYNKSKENNIIEFELYDDGEFLISVTDDSTISNGHSFLFTKEEFEELKIYFKTL